MNPIFNIFSDYILYKTLACLIAHIQTFFNEFCLSQSHLQVGQYFQFYLSDVLSSQTVFKISSKILATIRALFVASTKALSSFL